MNKWSPEKAIEDYDLDGLKELREAGRSALSEILEADEPTQEQVDAALEYDQVIGQINESIEAKEAEVAKVADFDALRQRHAEAEQAEPEPEPEAEVEEVQEPAAEVAEDIQGETEQVESAPEAEVKEPVAAQSSARQALAGRRPAPRKNEGTQLDILAAPDVRGFSAGQDIDGFTGLAKAFQSRTSGFRAPSAGSSPVRQEFQVASMRTVMDPSLIADGTNDEEVVNHAADASRLPGGSLTAAAGWCAPSETIYDLCDTGQSTEGNWSIPEFTVTRGGVRYTQGPDFSGLYAAGFDLTEAELIGGATKSCFEIPCPDFEEVRLDAVGFCITSNILAERGYPEVTAAFLREAAVAHQNKIAKKLLTQAIATVDTPVTSTGLGSTAGSTLGALTLLADSKRGINGWSPNQVIEVVLPFWMRGAMRTDYSMRTGIFEPAVADAALAAQFATRNLSVQFVKGWQDLDDDAVQYPENVQAFLYREGTFTKGRADVISLSAVYDSTKLANNQYTAAFFEEGVLLLTRCYGASVVNIPMCVGGITGAASNANCLAATTTP